MVFAIVLANHCTCVAVYCVCLILLARLQVLVCFALPSVALSYLWFANLLLPGFILVFPCARFCFFMVVW